MLALFELELCVISKHNCELFILDELLTDESDMLITWQRWYVLDILKHNNIDYNQVLMDYFIRDIDHSLRLSGIGDMSIGKYVKTYV